MMKDISKNYITIQGWMVTKLNLSGNELLTYALIYGFSQDNQSEFSGSINYVCTWLNCSKNTALKALKSLVKKGLINKTHIVISGVKLVKYSVRLGGAETEPVVQKLNRGGAETEPGGGAETEHNNTNIYIYKESSAKKQSSKKRPAMTYIHEVEDDTHITEKNKPYFLKAKKFFEQMYRNAQEGQHKWPHLGKQRAEDACNHVRLMHKHPYDDTDILKIFRCLQVDEFWKGQIQSFEGLRKKQSKILTAYNQKHKNDEAVGNWIADKKRKEEAA